MIENNKEPDQKAFAPVHLPEFSSLYDAFNSMIVKSGDLEEFQKELIKEDPSLADLFKEDGTPIDNYKLIHQHDFLHVGAYFTWLQLCLGVYAYYFLRQRTSELKNSLTGIDSKLNELQGTLDTLEDEVKANTAAIAALDKDLTAKMTENVADIVQNAKDNTAEIIKAIP